MKPISLEISAWGPYKKVEQIEFTKLWERGLFLVTGPTGAGKTTVFDAISFAIYGNLSGQMREKNSVRSDFADGDTKTYVRLKMEHKGQIYEIYRNPEYMRPKKRKTGADAYTKERENAILTMPDESCTLEVPEVRCDFPGDASAEMGLISPGGENLLDFLELRQVLSTYDWDLRDPLLWPQERPVPM